MFEQSMNEKIEAKWFEREMFDEQKGGDAKDCLHHNRTDMSH